MVARVQPEHVATHVATQAASAGTQRHLADLKDARSEPKRPLAAHREPIAIAVQDREAEGSNPSPPTLFEFRFVPRPELT